jgi:biotin operon repressor
VNPTKLGIVPPEKLAEWASKAHGNMVLMLANLPTDEQRRVALEGYAQRSGQQAADELRREVWTAIQSQRHANPAVSSQRKKGY